jgi:hypothetical protein
MSRAIFRRCPHCQHVLAERKDVLTLSTRDGVLLAEVTVFRGVDSGFVAWSCDDVVITAVGTEHAPGGPVAVR